MKAWLLENGPSARRSILLVLVAGIPVLFLRFTADPINVPKLALLLVGVSLVIALRGAEILQGASHEGLRRLWIPVAAIVVPITIGWLLAPYRGYSFLGEYQRYQGWLPYVAAAIFGVLLADAFPGRGRQIAWALYGAAGFIGAYALLQFVEADPLRWALATEETSLATSTLGNPNFVGGFLGISLPLGIGLWRLEVDRRWAVAGLGVLVTGGWLVAQSQGGWAAGLAGSLVAGSFLLTGRIKRARLLAGIAAALIALAAAGSVVATVVAPGNKSIPGTVRLRGEAWKAATKLALDSPVVGRGPNAYAIEGVQHRSQLDAARFNYNFPDDPHSVFLSLSVAAGILGAAGFLLLLLWSLRRGFALADENILGGAFFGAVVAYFVQSLVSIDEQSLRIAFWSALAGLVVSSIPSTESVESPTSKRRRAKRRSKQEPLRAAPGVALLALAALAALWWSANLVLADARAHWASDLIAAGNIPEGRFEFERAIGFMHEPEYRSRYGQVLGRIATEQQDNTVFQAARHQFAYTNDLPDVFGIVSEARLIDDWIPIDASVGDEGVALYERALALDPLNPLIRVELADTLVDLGRGEEALEVLEPATEVARRRYPVVWGGLASARFEVGDIEGAREAIERAFALDPEEAQAKAVQQLIEQSEG